MPIALQRQQQPCKRSAPLQRPKATMRRAKPLSETQTQTVSQTCKTANGWATDQRCLCMNVSISPYLSMSTRPKMPQMSMFNIPHWCRTDVHKRASGLRAWKNCSLVGSPNSHVLSVQIGSSGNPKAFCSSCSATCQLPSHVVPHCAFPQPIGDASSLYEGHDSESQLDPRECRPVKLQQTMDGMHQDIS